MLIGFPLYIFLLCAWYTLSWPAVSFKFTLYISLIDLFTFLLYSQSYWSRSRLINSSTYVRPLLEYNSFIWSPYLKQNNDRIEQVQRRFSKRLHGLRTYTYKNRLKLLNLFSLELRRLRNDLARCYKIVFSLTVLKFDDFLSGILLLRHAVTLSNCTKETASCVHRSRAVFFSERVIDVWNQLIESTDFRSLSLFMRSICCMDLSHYSHI